MEADSAGSARAKRNRLGGGTQKCSNKGFVKTPFKNILASFQNFPGLRYGRVYRNYNPLLALAQPFYNQLASPLHMWCILTLLII